MYSSIDDAQKRPCCGRSGSDSGSGRGSSSSSSIAIAVAAAVGVVVALAPEIVVAGSSRSH